MDKDRSTQEESLLLQLPMELLVYIISFVSLLPDRIKLCYVSKFCKYVIEGTPSVWKEFVLPYCGSCEEYAVKKMLNMYGKNIKILSFPKCNLQPSTLVKMLQYCSNVQCLNLSSTILDPDQLKRITQHMQHLQSLEIKIKDDGIYGSDIKELLLTTLWLKQLTIVSSRVGKIFVYLNELEIRPPSLIAKPWAHYDDDPAVALFGLVSCVSPIQWSTTVSTGATATFTLYTTSTKIPLNFSPRYPCLQLEYVGSGHDQVSTRFVKLSDFGVLNMKYNLAVMSDCKYDKRTMYVVKCIRYRFVVNKLKSMHIPKLYNLSCATDFDLSNCDTLHSGHLEQLAVACPNLQRLNLQKSNGCLERLQGLKAIANHCDNLQGLNLLYIPVSKVEDHILFWEILSNIKLTHLAVEFCFLKLENYINKVRLICLYQICLTIRGIQCGFHHECSTNEDTSILCHFPSLNYCYLRSSCGLSTDVINSCKELKCFAIKDFNYNGLSLNMHRTCSLQQLCIDSFYTHITDDFMIKISAHGGLVHVVMGVKSFTGDGMLSLVRNSPKLITLHLCGHQLDKRAMESFNVTLKKTFYYRKLITGGYCMVSNEGYVTQVLYEQDTDLMPLWNYCV